ncbi:MAG: hypothetical protein V4583_15895 [Pseudomonadota bacterium]
MISNIRASLPLADNPLAPPLHEPKPAGQYPSGASGPVAAPLQVQAVQQPPPKPGAGDRHLVEARMATENNAAAAANAAREAYIQASIAAGISPLPLP